MTKYLTMAYYAQLLLPTRVLSSAEWCHRNKEWEALRILHSLEKFHHHCFAYEVYIITYHKPLVAIISKDVATLSQHLDGIMLCIHEYGVHIICKSGRHLYIADCLFWNNHIENRDQEIAAISINMNAISTSVNILVCTSKEIYRWQPDRMQTSKG